MYGRIYWHTKEEIKEWKDCKAVEPVMHVQVNKFEWLFLTLTLVPILVVVIDIFSQSKKKKPNL